MLVNGTQEEKLEWTFHLYDLDGDGVISREEMEDVVISVILFSLPKISNQTASDKISFNPYEEIRMSLFLLTMLIMNLM